MEPMGRDDLYFGRLKTRNSTHYLDLSQVHKSLSKESQTQLSGPSSPEGPYIYIVCVCTFCLKGSSAGALEPTSMCVRVSV